MIISAIPAALLLLHPGVFFYFLPFWILVGFAALIRLAVFVLKPVLQKFDQLSPNHTEETA